ncbi:MAG: InlB B-repeat-containing protein [Bacteroidales bacterium]|nr:InlB B-repeat-containing protein [Bacteroidales bacterium]
MKKFLLATLCILIGVLAFAQAPQKISYQAVIRNNSGNLVTNQQVWLRISIMRNGGTTGQIDQPISNRSIVAIYTETHTVTTNANGLATIEIGGGTTSDNFAAIDWSNGTYYLKTSVDLTGRGRYEVMGMSQLISVPYAMYAQKAGSAATETDPQFNAWDKDYNDLTNRPEIPVVPTNVSAFTNDANYITSADVPAQVNADWNATSGAGQILNKPELFSGNYNDLTNKPAIPTVPTNVSAFTNDANYITSADVPAQVNADWNATSGAGQILNKPELFSGNYNDLTNRPEIPVVPTNVSAFENDAQYITSADVPAQVNADWNATIGAGQILNKPTIPTVPTNVSAFTNDANYITSADVPAQVNADWTATSGAGQILNKPEIPTVPTNVSAFTNDANYITSADVPAQVNADWNATSGAGQILNKPEIPTVPTNVSAFTNDANYITSADVPAQVNADWNATSGAGQILNKPELFSGNYNDLTNKPAIPTVPTNVSAFTNDANYITSADVPVQVNADWNATSGAGQILNKPELFSGNYNDLANKPEIPTVPTNVSALTNDANYITSADIPAQVKADWNATSGAGQILNKPELFSGDYNDLANRPEIPTVPTNVSALTNDANYITSADVPAQVNADWNATSGAGQILNKPELFSGNYNDLTNKPEIPTVPTNVSAFTNDANYITSADIPAQVNADWNATSGAGQIMNKPEIPTVPTNVSAFVNDANYITSADVPAQVNADWNVTSGAGQILNKPEIPTVPTNVSAFTNDANYITSADVPAQVNADWNATSGAGQILNKPELFDGNYNNLTNIPDLSGYITTEAQTLTDVVALSNSAGDRQIKNVADPTENQDAVTKKYVDGLIAALQAQNAALQAQIAEMQATIDAFSATHGGGSDTLTTGILNGHEWVDLGLPSGTLWATCNVGASTPTDYGYYYAWGETTTKNSYSWTTYSLCNGTNSTLIKYCNKSSYGNNGFTDNLTTLEESDDAATANWGSGWRMPTFDEQNELKNNCTVTWTTQNGVNGRLFTGPNGNSIFLPAAGYRDGSELHDAGSLCHYRSSSLDTDNPYNAGTLYFNSDYCLMYYNSRYYGYTVRPVCSQNDTGNSSNPSQPTSYTVTFDANGGTGTMNPQTFTAGEAQTLTTNTFTKENNNFTGWNTAADGSGNAYTDGQSITVSENMTLYAQWNLVVTYTIIFNSNGGSGDMNSQTFTAGEAQTLTTNTFTKENNNFTGWNTAADGSGNAYTDGQSITATENMTLYAQWQAITSGSYSGYEWVDLGLPSGTLWATCNVGASAPEAYGNYYSWGEIATKSNYNWIAYKYCNGSYQTLTKYCNNSELGNNGFTDNLSVLETSDDAATTNLGGYWRMPTDDETTELKNNCSAAWIVQNGINGQLFTGPNGNSIFIPAAGYKSQSSVADNGTRGEYWTNALDTGFPDNAKGISFTSTGCSLSSLNRDSGRPVRPVCTVQNSSVASYTITFDANGGIGAMNSQSFIAETAQTLASNAFTMTNYAFTGWNTAADGSGTAYADGQSITVSSSMTLYAQWAIAYTVTFDANGGTGTMDNQTFSDGIEQVLAINAFRMTYYTFAGWNTVADGSGIAYADGQSIIVTADMTLYAQWEESASGRFTDSRDGISYKYVKLGSQTWMAENLRYGDGVIGISITPESSTTKKLRYYPENSSSNVSIYGYLYNWKAATNGASGSSTNPSNVQGICPNGWHLPSDAEWTQLTDYLSSQSQYQCGGTSENIARSLASTSYWTTGSSYVIVTDACGVAYHRPSNNSTGFDAKPAGNYNPSGSFGSTGLSTGFWSATDSGDTAYYRSLSYGNAIVTSGTPQKSSGYSIRCVRDN